MWRILQHDVPDDFVIATGKNYAVRDFVQYAFNEIGETIVLDFSFFLLHYLFSQHWFL